MARTSHSLTPLVQARPKPLTLANALVKVATCARPQPVARNEQIFKEID